MKTENQNAARTERKMKSEIRALLIDLKTDIWDDCRAHEYDDKPGMRVTVATDDMQSWSYQTGDNSYSGGCYGYRHWSVIFLYRRSNCTDLANDAVNELADTCAEAASCDAIIASETSKA